MTDIDIIIEERRNRNYTGSQLSEYILLTKKFLMLSPLYLSGYYCSHISYEDYSLNVTNVFIQISSSLFIISVDRFIKWPAISTIIFSICALSINHPIVYHAFHEYILYGIVWNIGIKLCDYEDAQRLFPGFALLYTPSIYLMYIFKITRYILCIPYIIILCYILCFHQKWKHDKTNDQTISNKSYLWWFSILMIFNLCHWICYTQTTKINIIKDERIFDVYQYLDIDYIKYKGICTFVIMFITNSQIFTNFSWKVMASIFSISIFILKYLDYFVNIDISFTDTIAFGLSYYLYEPVYQLIFTNLHRQNWWLNVPIATLFKPFVFNVCINVDLIDSLIPFTIFWFIMNITIYLIYNEFKLVDI